MDAYVLVLDEAAAMTLAAVSRPQQRRLGVVLDGLKAAPFRPGDFQQRDAAGRLQSSFDFEVTAEDGSTRTFRAFFMNNGAQMLMNPKQPMSALIDAGKFNVRNGRADIRAVHGYKP